MQAAATMLRSAGLRQALVGSASKPQAMLAPASRSSIRGLSPRDICSIDRRSMHATASTPRSLLRSSRQPQRIAGLVRYYASKPPRAEPEAADEAAAKKAKAQAEQGATPAAGEASESAFPSDPAAHPSARPPAPITPATASARRSTSAFDVDTSELIAAAEEQDAKNQTTGARSRGSSQSSQEKRKNLISRMLGVVIVLGSGYIVINLGREWDTVAEREKFGDDPLSSSFLGRLRLRLQSMYTSVQAPVWEKLLPDPLPFPYQRGYTLVIDVDDLLIHSEWSRAHAWRTAKRPGLDYFLGYLSQFYEIVVYSRQPMHVVAPVIEKLDPDMRLITYSVFRESCRTLDNGHVVKDLNALNRDLSKVIAIDTDPEALELNPENAVILKPWKGDPNDRELLGLVSFLEAVQIYNIEDVRETIKSFAGQNIPTEHAKRQAQVKADEEAKWRAKGGAKGGSWFGSIREGGAPTSSGMPKTFYEQEHDRFQALYDEELKFWRENGEKLRQQAKEEQEKKLKEMKLSAWGFITGQGMQTAPTDQQPKTA